MLTDHLPFSKSTQLSSSFFNFSLPVEDVDDVLDDITFVDGTSMEPSIAVFFLPSLCGSSLSSSSLIVAGFLPFFYLMLPYTSINAEAKFVSGIYLAGIKFKEIGQKYRNVPYLFRKL